MKKLLLSLLLLPFAVQAEWLQISDAWVRAAPPNARVMVAYATVKNTSTDSIWITGAASDAFNSVELHETIEENGMASMIHLDFIKLDAGQTVHFEPGGKHMMLFGPKQFSKEGETIDFSLQLGNGDRENFTAVVARDQP
ncbi:MAG: copper chaperone PCu(A)C [Chromatiales bacterium]|jgi:copper(I)-binding protein